MMRACSPRDRLPRQLSQLLAVVLTCLLTACDQDDVDASRGLLDASTGGEPAGPQVDGQLQSDAGAHDASTLDARVTPSQDGAVQLGDGGAISMDLCGNVRPSSPSASGVLPGSVELLPAIEQHRGVRGRGPGVSALLGGRLLWLFGATFDESSGRLLASNSATLSSFDRPFALDEAAPLALAPTTLLPDAAADRDAGVSAPLTYALGTPIAVGLNSALVFYTPSATQSSTTARGSARLGTRVARLRSEFATITAEPESALVFPASAPSFRSGLLAGDGYVYLYGCRPRPAGNFDCLLARAQGGNATRAGGYTYRTAGGWSNDLTVATVVLADMHEDLTVAYNDYLRSYLAVSLHGPEARITLRSAPRPEGPWTPLGEVDLPPIETAQGEQLGFAVEQHALASKCDKVLTLSYVRTARTGEAQLLPLKVELK